MVIWGGGYESVGGSGSVSTGSITNVSNIGDGEGLVFKELSGSVVQLKTLKAGTNIILENNENDITINSSGNVTEIESFLGNEFKLISPYVTTFNEYKGNLHSHTTESDGVDTPTQVMNAYKDAGYNFNAITDHNIITSDPGVSDILFLSGVESDVGNFYFHINRIMPGTLTSFNSIESILSSASVERSFVYINHPVNEITSRDIGAQRHYYGVEVWNSFYSEEYNRLSENKIDEILTNGGRIYLLAGDDLHDLSNSKYLTGAVYVYANNLTQDDIITNLKRGNFYSSNGALISSINVSNKSIQITVPATSSINFIGKNGITYFQSTGSIASTYNVVGDEKYIRVRVRRESDGKEAWTNPIFITSNETFTNHKNNNSVLTEDRVLYLSPFLSSSTIQAVIDMQPKNLNGHTLTFQFLEGTFTLNSTLFFNNFIGGNVRILGNSSDNTLSVTKSVFLDFTGSIGVSINNCLNVEISYLKIRVAGNTYFCIESYRNHFLLALGNYLYSTTAASSRGIFTYGTLAHIQNCMFGLLGSGLMGDGSTTIYSQTNDDGGAGNQPINGLRASRAATIGKYDAIQPSGSISDELAETGGVIR